MAKFEVFIPGSGGGFNMTLRVDADNWMAALKTGMQKLGEQGSNVQNVLVDIQDDNSIHVTESRSGRVFRIRELSDAEAAAAPVKKNPSQTGLPAYKKPAAAPTQPRYEDDDRTAPGDRPPMGGDEPAPRQQSKPSASRADPSAQPTPPERFPNDAVTEPPAGKTMQMDPAVVMAGIQSARGRSSQLESAGVPVTPQAAGAPAALEPRPARPVSTEPAQAPAPRPKPVSRTRHEPERVVELEHPTHPVVGNIGRSRPPKRETKEQIEDVLAEVFERVQEIHFKANEEEALYYLLDLALEKIPAESGSVYGADAGTGDLNFIAVRGPKAAEILRSKIAVPQGAGIAGFCATEGVSVAVSDVEKDPRFYAAISEKVDYDVKSAVCAPMMTHGRTFGCVQLLNKKGGSSFGEHEVGILSYIAHQGALYLNRRV